MFAGKNRQARSCVGCVGDVLNVGWRTPHGTLCPQEIPHGPAPFGLPKRAMDHVCIQLGQTTAKHVALLWAFVLFGTLLSCATCARPACFCCTSRRAQPSPAQPSPAQPSRAVPSRAIPCDGRKGEPIVLIKPPIIVIKEYQ